MTLITSFMPSSNCHPYIPVLELQPVVAMENELKYWLAFNLIPGIGKVRFALIESHFHTMENAWKASASELKEAGLDSRTIESIVQFRPRINPDKEEERLVRYGIKAITCNDSSYPARLKEIYDYPPVLYIRGNLTTADEWALAVVGTRRVSVYGRQVAEELASDLVRNKITIVSGLARGVDSIAHRAALQAGGRTIAVFGCGLDIIYPAEHAALAKQIIEQGALISEHPPGIKPKAENFPRRNRIMSGISLGVLVIEAGEISGALNTANHALEQNREVFAVPGSIYSPNSRGTNRLIQEGARLVTKCSDILEELNLTMIPEQLEMKELLPSDQTEAAILHYVSREAVHIDELCRQTGLSIASISSTLSLMELKGMIKQLGGMRYVLAH